MTQVVVQHPRFTCFEDYLSYADSGDRLYELFNGELRLNMTPPELVVEVVSPGEVQHDRDYVAKRYQYHDRRIPTYWIVDPQSQVIVVLTWVNQGYQEQHYRDNDYLPFQGAMLSVTAGDVLSAGRA